MNTFHSKLPNHFDLPKRINRLGELAYNLWWTWQPEAARVFGRLDYDLWESSAITQFLSCARLAGRDLNQAADEKEYLALYDRVFASFDAYMSQTETWAMRALIPN